LRPSTPKEAIITICVFHDSGNLVIGGMFGTSRAEAPPDRIPVFEIKIGKRLVHHSDLARGGLIVLSNRAALQQARTDGLELGWADAVIRCEPGLRRGAGSFQVSTVDPIISAHRRVKRETG
jgi:hypothetical protein